MTTCASILVSMKTALEKRLHSYITQLPTQLTRTQTLPLKVENISKIGYHVFEQLGNLFDCLYRELLEYHLQMLSG